MNENNNISEDEVNGNEGVSASGTRPAVAAAPGKMVFILIIAGIVLFIILKSLFFPSAAPVVKPKPPVERGPEAPQKPIETGGLPTPPQPTITPVIAPPPPPPPVIQPPAPPPQINQTKVPQNDVLKARIHSSMIASGNNNGGTSVGGGSSAQKKRSSVANSSDPNSAFAQSASDLSNSEVTVATKVGDLNRTIVQGKTVEGVLETAIDSTLPGSVRAIVSHDTYAEAGRKILIPKGSRIVGTYNSSVRRGQARVFIIWSRIIRPDGVDIAIDSAGTDALGRAGMAGDVDNKYFETFSTAIMVSSLDIAVAAAGQGLFGNQQQTTTTSGGGTTSTSSPTSTATQTAVQNIGTIGQSIVGSTLNLSPTIHVDQGTEIRIFVNKDLLFPDSVTGESQFIQ